MQARRLILDAAAALAIGGAIYFAWQFAGQPGWQHIGLACLLAYAALRITYEMTINRHSVPTIASAPAVRRQVASLIADDAASKGTQLYKVVDLGSGRGELARTIAKTVPAATVTGVELALFPHLRSNLWQRLFGPKNLAFVQGDFFAYDCTDASAIMLFLGKLTVPAGEKLKAELAPGSLVISNDFELGMDWPAPERIVLRTPFKTVLYIYRHR